MARLDRELTLFDLVFYGVGVIFGAGIYVLIGSAAGVAGNTVWLSFLIAAAVAALTGLSYAELSSMYPKDAAEYTYVKQAFRDESTGFVIGWLTFCTAVVAGSVVALGFGKYFHSVTGINPIIPAAALIILFSVVNFMGIKLSSKINILLTTFTVLGLLLVVIIGAPHWGSVDYFESPGGIAGTLGAATLIFFAYLGFDEIVNVSEEAKGARKNVPKAIVISIIITTTFYMLVSISAVSTVPWQELGQSGTPLALVARTVLGDSTEFMLSAFAILATAGTTLIFMISGSRMIFGMAEVHALPKALSSVNKKYRTPHVAIALIGSVSLAFVWLGDMEQIALMVNFAAFTIFALINLSAFALRFSKPNLKREFRVPFSIGQAPVFPLLGFMISAYMLMQFTQETAWSVVALMIIGYLIYKYGKAERSTISLRQGRS